MVTYNAIAGQSLSDICLNTYGSMDYFIKMLTDNGIANADAAPSTGQPILWDNTLVADQAVSRQLTLSNIRYATSAGANGNTYYIIQGGQTGGDINPPPPPSLPVQMYQKTSNISYTATVDGESVIYIPTLVGKSITQIERETHPLLDSEYAFNPTTGVITLPAIQLAAGETLFILYSEIIVI